MIDLDHMTAEELLAFIRQCAEELARRTTTGGDKQH